MLTDEDLTRELGAAFRAAAQDLTYTGRRRPRRTAVVAVPVAAVGIALAAVAITAALDAAPEQDPLAGQGAAPSAAPLAHPRTVTEKVSLAGYTMTYERTEGRPAPLYATAEPGPVPDGFTPVDNPANTGAKAWVGKDPTTGENALYVQVPTRNGGDLFALHSDGWTQDELVDLYLHGTRRPVPLVEQ